MMKRRDFLNSAAAFAASAMAVSGAGQVLAQGRGRMTFMTPQGYSLSFSTVMYGVTGGFFEAEGIDVTVEGGRGAAQTVQLTAARQVEAGRTGGANYMVARNENNAPVIAFATIAQVSPFFMISPASDPIDTPEAFLNRTVGMASLGGSMEATLDLMLRRNGLNPSLVRRERVADTPAAFGLIEARRLDGFFGNVSTTTRLIGQGLPINAMAVRDGIPGQVYVAHETDLQERRDDYVRFMRGCYAAIQDMVAHGDDLEPVIASMRTRFDIPGSDNTEVAVEDLKGNRALWTAMGVENALRCIPEEWEGAEALLREAGSLSSPATRPFYTNDIWDRIAG